MLASTLSIAFSFLIAGIFFASGSSKLRRENHFYYQKTIENYDIVPAAWSGPLVSIIACYEIIVALLTFIPAYQKLGLIMAAAILSVYCYSFIKQLAQGKVAVSCGCAGPSSDLTVSTGLVLRNMALVILCLMISFMSWSELEISWGVVVPTTIVIGLVYLSIDQLLSNDQKIQALRLSQM